RCILQAALQHERLGEPAIHLECKTAAFLERDRYRLLEPFLSRFRVVPGERVEPERAEVLDLEVRFGGALQPVSRLEAESLRLVEVTAVVLDQPERERRAGLVAPAAEVLGKVVAARQL